MIFANGKIKAVGLQSQEDIDTSLLTLQRHLESHRGSLNGSGALLQEKEEPYQFRDTTFCMINTDFVVNFKLLREEIYRIIRKRYGVTCSYEPDIYPGVKVRYYYNSAYWEDPYAEGRCYCKRKCNGKRPKSVAGEGGCKAVTICVFQSGKIIITGANGFEQIDKCYNFITRILLGSYEDLVYVEPTLLKKKNGDLECLTRPGPWSVLRT
jgi:TATA-box binding protein (TBP) (component of TFIID and TFIIIB)